MLSNIPGTVGYRLKSACRSSPFAQSSARAELATYLLDTGEIVDSDMDGSVSLVGLFKGIPAESSLTATSVYLRRH